MKSKLAILLLISLFLIAACGKNSINPNVRSGGDYRTGSQGLEMNFVKNAPPYKIYTGDQLDIIVELQNRGAWPPDDIFNGFLVIHGFDESAIIRKGNNSSANK